MSKEDEDIGMLTNDTGMLAAILEVMKAVHARRIVVIGDRGIVTIEMEHLELPSFKVPPIDGV
jgi:hypothetical protein